MLCCASHVVTMETATKSETVFYSFCSCHRASKRHATVSAGSFQRSVSDAALEQVDRDAKIRWSLRVRWNGIPIAQ